MSTTVAMPWPCPARCHPPPHSPDPRRPVTDEAIRPWSVVEGVPEWNDLFDVNAQSRGPLPETPPGTVGPIHLMMQALLADRWIFCQPAIKRSTR